MAMNPQPPRAALILDGSGAGDARTQAAAEAVRDALSRAGVSSETVVARDLDIDPCIGCFGCWIKRPGECVFDGPSQGIARKWAASDLLVVVTPVTFGGYSSELKKVIDRVVCSLALPFFTSVRGEIHHPLRYSKLPEFVALGTLPAPDADAQTVFETLVARNALNMRSGMSASAVVCGDPTPAELATVASELLERAGVVGASGESGGAVADEAVSAVVGAETHGAAAAHEPITTEVA